MVDDLGYKSIFRTFYPSMFYPTMEDNDYEGSNLPKTGIVENKNKYLATMYPPEEYTNASSESRYLVYIKKREIEKNVEALINGKWVKIENGTYSFSNTCHVCDGAKADLYIFKKNQDGKFELIARTPKNFSPPNVFGDVYLNISNLKKRIVDTGDQEVGFFDDNFNNTNFGVTDSLLYLVRLNESGIKGYDIGLSSGDNLAQYEDINTPLAYEYKSEYQTIVSDKTSIYSVEMKFSGDAPNEETGRIENYNWIKTFKYDATKDSFKLISESKY